jgi:hypothetical protein
MNVMAIWLQHLVVLCLVGTCLAYTTYQGVRSLRGKKSRLGSCCAKGCAATKPAAATTEKIHFLPVEMLRRKRP